MANGRLRTIRHTGPAKQSGAVLLVFILVMMAGASYMLVSRLNEYSHEYKRKSTTEIALNQAKQALLSYAMNYPELRSSAAKGPGFLPCPAQNETGDPTSGCAVSTGTTLGRLPYKILGLADLRESGGDLLWYAVSDNYKNTLPNTTILNSETPGLLSVDGANDIVAVIIAPGSPVADQNNRPGNDKADYLEGINADSDASTYVSSGAGEFNDRLITITRQELMAVAEQRVINEIRAVMEGYRAQNGAFPWLTSFTDPKADILGTYTGAHDGSGNSTSLVDSSAEFIDWQIKAGDVVRNLSDGSVATVSGVVSATTLNLTGFALGVDNDFDNGDEYIIYSALDGTADLSSNNLLLVDANMNFIALGLTPGDIVDKFDGTDKSNMSSGVITSVSEDRLTLGALNGAAVNSFSPGDTYLIRSNRGRASGPADSLNLIDADKDFNLMGVQAGDLLVNLTDGSMGRVESVAGSTTLVMGQMYHGIDNDFDPGDSYYLPRYNTDNVSTAGLLSLHQDNEHFRTDFSIDWDLSAASVGGPVVTALFPHPVYTADLAGKVQSSAGGTGTAFVSIDSGQCVWTMENVAECSGVYQDPAFPVQGTVTSGNNTDTLNDANADFVTTAIKRGDIVRNFDDEIATGISGTASSGTDDLILRDTSKNFNTLGIIPYHHLIHNTSAGGTRGLIVEVIDNNTLRLAGFAGRAPISFVQGNNYTIYSPQLAVVSGVNSATQLTTARVTATAPDFDVDGGGFQEFYQINVATGLTPTRVVDSFTFPGTRLFDAGANFSDIQPGDIVENLVDNAFGIITSVDAVNDELQAQLYASDGTTRSFNAGENYRIYYNHDVVFRRYEFRTRFTGSVSANVYSSAQQRQRTICIGYGTGCAVLSAAETIPQQETAVVIRDFDGNGNEVANIDVSVPAAGSSGSIRITGIDYYPAESNTELPGWLLHNKWHQYLYTAYSGGLAPGAAGNCVPGTSCLNLSIQRPNGIDPVVDIEGLVVMAAGRPLSAQDRITGAVSDYFEAANSVPNLFYEQNEITSLFNDRLRFVTP